MKVTCHSCGAKYAIADDKVRGRRVKVRCKSCATPIVVDGYAVDSGDSDPAAAGGADDWSVNLSDTDQRTMSTDEIIAGWHSGLIREDAFVWKDGMDDWKPVLEVPELAGRFFERRPSSPSPAYAAPAPAAPPWQAPADNGAQLGGGFGFGGAQPVAAAARPAAAARVSGGRAAGGDLFSNVAAAGSEEEATHAFPSSMPASQPYDDKPTGARNENSVLFSLDALKAGFTPTAQATPGPTRPAANTGGTANLDDLMNIGGSSGSPLFGFSQNQALLHAPPPPPEPPPPPPPDLSAPASLVPSYAPAASPQKSSKLIFAVAALLAVLVVAGVGLAVVMGGKKDEVAQNDDKKSGDDEKKSATGDDSDKKEAEAKKDEERPSEEAKKDEGEAKKDEEKVPVTEEDKKRFAEAQKKKEEEAKKKPEEDKKKEDEVVKKDQPSSGVGSFNKGAAISALSSAAAAASGCKRPGGPTGSGRAVVTFAPSGRATSANVTGGSFGGTSVGGCIASVFRRAKVPPFDGNSVTVSKSFNIAP